MKSTSTARPPPKDPRTSSALLAAPDEYLASRINESLLMSALSAKYGTDPAMDVRSLPPPAGAAVVELDLVEEELLAQTDGVTRQRGRNVGLESSDAAAAAAAAANGAVPPGGPLVTQLVLQHLRTAPGLGPAATLFEAELRGRGLPPEYYLTTRAPEAVLDMGRSSALSALLHPQDLTRAHIERLLSDAPAKLARTVAGSRHDVDTRRFLALMAEEPMWGATHRPEQRTREYYKPGTHVLRAAPVNHLVERITTVVVRPHVSVPSARQASDRGLMRALFRIHHHFVPSHALLAKLLQRFFLPSHLALEHTYDAHEIIIDAPMETASTLAPGIDAGADTFAARTQRKEACAVRARYHAAVSRELQLRVCGVLVCWLEAHPDHFDAPMLEALDVFVRENLLAPATWAPASGELQQFAEAIRGLMGSAVRRAEGRPRIDDAPQDPPRPRRVANPALVKGGHHEPHDDGPVEDDPMDFLFAPPPPGPRAYRDTGFLGVDDLALATQLTVLDHAAMLDIDPGELHTFTVVTALAGVRSATHPAPNVQRFLRRGEVTVHWLVTEVLTAGLESGDDDRACGARAAVVAKVVALAFRLLELNNVHAAFCCFAALRHPCVARLKRTWRRVVSQALHGLEELARFFSFERGPGPYLEYVASLRDDEVYPLVPVLQVALDEVRRIDAEPTVLRDAHGTGVVHWRKFAVLSRILSDFAAHRRSPLPGDIVPVPGCSRWIAQALAGAEVDPAALAELTARVEPVEE